MVRVRTRPPGNAALRWAAGCGEHWTPPSIRALRPRSIATNAAVREPSVEFPEGVPPAPVAPRRTGLERKEAIKNAKPFSDFLTDTFNRQHDYLRISITERCNLRCLYCMPEEGIPLSPSANMLTTPEIFYLSSLFVSQGVTKIRLTGGEPTVRRDIVPLMQQIGSLRPKGLRELALTTNGIALHRKLDAMVEAGLTGVNLSLDTLDPFQFQIMTRRKGFDAVMRSIDRILEMNKLGANVKLKVNCVVMRGLNEREILPFVEMGREKDIEVRFIEYMPFGGNKWSENKMISFQEMLDIIRTKYPGLRHIPGHKNDTSKTYEVPGFVGRVGFITSMTNDFCGTCNRLRITSDGNLKVCLHGNDEVSLRDLLRQGNSGEPIDQEAFERIRQLEMDRHEGRLSDETILGWGQRERELLDMIGIAVKKKAEKHADLNDLANMENRPMILIDRNASFVNPSLPWPMNQHQPKGAHATPLSLGRSVLPLLSSVSPSMISLRAFSTTPTPAAKHEYQTKNPRLEQNVSFKKVNQFLTRFSSGEDTERLGTRAPVASVKNLAIDTRELREFLGEIGLPQARKRLLKGIESKIRELESRIAGAKFFDVATDPGDWKQFSVSADKIMTGLNPKNERATKRSLWRERKRTSALLNEGQVDFDAEYKKLEDVQQKEISDMEAILDMYKAHAETIKAVLNGAEDLEKVRMQKRRLLSKKHELSKQLEKEKEEAQWAKTTRRFIPAKERETKAESFDLGDILDDAFIKAGGATEAMPELDMATFMPQPPSYGGSQQLKRISESNSTFKKFTARTPAAERISAMGGGLGGDVKPTTTKEMDMSSRSSNEDSLPSDLHPASNYDQTVPTPQRQPSDNLRLQVPQSGLISIDPDFTANFDTEVSDLQSQILQLQERLKSSYPRIDTLPFDVWTSNNQRTLRTWLKILVTRWQTRFDDAGGSSNNEEVKTSRVDENVKAVLDQMVRDHDLSNDAAERMARRWGQVFEKRGDIGGDAEGVLDWEEFDAVGMGFLKEGADSYVAEGRRSNSRDASFRAQNKGRIGFGQLSYKPLTRRLYSTSSRAASDPELSKDAKTTTSGPQQPSSQPSLPHLTSTGSAHMVSVSAKAHTVRTAIAVGTVYFSNPTPLSLIRSNSLKKGDVLSVSRIAGIMAAKKCPDLIPLCHPIALTHVGIELDVLDAKQSEGMGFGGVAVEAKVQCTGPTGVEMEALTAVMGATLTVVDMVKAVDKFQRVQDVRVVLKEGGKSGTWREEGWCSFQSPRVEG